MANNLDQFARSTMDWRRNIRQNNRRTYIIIFLFFLIYTIVGILVDLYLYTNIYPQADISQLFTALFTFQIFPLATIIMLVVATVSLFITYLMYDKLMMLGTNYHEITPETAN